MGNVLMPTRIGGMTEQIQMQRQQKPFEQISKETERLAAVDCFVSGNVVTDSVAKENSLGDESRMEILRHKLLLGCELGDEDLKYLKTNSPELYEEYMAAEDEREQEEKAYQRALRCCSTREDVNRLKNMSINRCVSRADSISKNKELSAEQRAIRIGAERRKLNDINRNDRAFKRSLQYASLPSEKHVTHSNAQSWFAALQHYAEMAVADAEERLSRLAREQYAHEP